jgi:hypothetical protein
LSYDYGDHPRHSPRTFPLGLLAPRCLGFLLILAISALRSGGEGRRLFGGRKESFPQLRLVSAGLDQPAQPTPFLVFISEFFSSLYIFSCLLRRRSSVSQDALAEMSEAQMQMRLTHPPVRAQARSQRRRGMRAGLPRRILIFQFSSTTQGHRPTHFIYNRTTQETGIYTRSITCRYDSCRSRRKCCHRYKL